MPKHILIVDDDPLLRRSLAFNLQSVGYTVQSVASGEATLAHVQNDPPCLILLDLGLPGLDGLEVLRQLRGQIPILIVTARQRHLDEVLGLELGADDYVTKPFEFDVLLARIRNILRRSQQPTHPPSTPPPSLHTSSTAMIVGEICIDPAAHTVMLGKKPINLSPREFRLLEVLAGHANHVVTTESLINQVWGDEFLGEPQIVYVYIRSLREKIERDPQHPQRILTIRGIGYKLVH